MSERASFYARPVLSVRCSKIMSNGRIAKHREVEVESAPACSSRSEQMLVSTAVIPLSRPHS